MELVKKYFGNLSPEQYAKFEQLQDLYHFWNSRINVISRKDLDKFYEHHVLHSLALAYFITENENRNIVDIGTGGGFPGIPLAIFYPKIHFVLADSIRKKIKVVNEVIHALNLINADTFNGRAEDLPANTFDMSVSRAVAPLSKLGAWSKKILKSQNNGLICLKGGDLHQEIQESGIPTRLTKISDYFKEPFFETKFVTKSQIV